MPESLKTRLVILVVAMSLGCTSSTEAVDDGTNLVFPNTDFTGRSFTAVVPETGRTTVYATETDTNFFNLKRHLYGLCAQRVASRFRDGVDTIVDPDGTQIGLIVAANEYTDYILEDAHRCGKKALERASIHLCAAYETLALAETVDVRNVVVYEDPSNLLEGILIDRIERPGISAPLPTPWQKADDYDVLIPPQDAHGTGTLAMLALWYFRDAALVSAGALDQSRCPQSTNALDQVAGMVNGPGPDGRLGMHPAEKVSSAQLAALVAGEALEGVDSALQVMRAALLAQAQARLSGSGAPEESTRLSWSGPHDSRLELANQLVGAKASLFEPMDLVLPRPVDFVQDAGIGHLQFQSDNVLSTITREELSSVLRGEFPEVTIDTSSPAVTRALDLTRSLGIDIRTNCTDLLEYYQSVGKQSEGNDAVDACNAWNGVMPRDVLARRLRIALVTDYNETFASSCAVHTNEDEEFLTALGVDPNALVTAARRLVEEASALGVPLTVDTARTLCVPTGSDSYCGSSAEGTACTYDIRITGTGQRSPVDPAYFMALVANRSRPVPAFYLREDQVTAVDGGFEVNNPGNWNADYLIGAGLQPFRWYPGHNGSRIANYQTNVFGADELIRGYSGQGVFETRDAVAAIIKDALTNRTDLDANTATGAADARPTLRAVYLQHRQSVPMRLQVCTGSVNGATNVAYAELWGTAADFASNEFEWRVAYGESHLNCLLRSSAWGSTSVVCPDPIATAQAPHLLARTNTTGDLNASRVWAWRPADIVNPEAYSAPTGRIYLLRRPVGETSPGEIEVVTGFTAEWEEWRVDGGPDGGLTPGNPISTPAYLFEGTETAIRLNRCNWYPVGPEVTAAVADVLTPSSKEATLPQTLCGDVNQDVKLPLEDSLSTNQLSSETIESSFRHFLELARQAADEADLLGETLIDNGLVMDERAETARDELEETCGGRVNVGDIASQWDLSNVQAGEGIADHIPEDTELEALRNCLGVGVSGDGEVVSFGTTPLCVYRHKATGAVCGTEEGMPACPRSNVLLADCTPAFFELEDPEDYEAILTRPLNLVVTPEPQTGGDAPPSCGDIARFRMLLDQAEANPQPTSWVELSELSAKIATQHWFDPFEMRKLATKLSFGVGIPSAEHPDFKFATLAIDGEPVLSTGSVHAGPNACGATGTDVPCGGFLDTEDVSEAANWTSYCAAGGTSIYGCGLGPMATNAQRLAIASRLRLAWIEIKRMTGTTDTFDEHVVNPAAADAPLTLGHAFAAMGSQPYFPQVANVFSDVNQFPEFADKTTSPGVSPLPSWMMSGEFAGLFPSENLLGLRTYTAAPYSFDEGQCSWVQNGADFELPCPISLPDAFPCDEFGTCTSEEWDGDSGTRVTERKRGLACLGESLFGDGKCTETEAFFTVSGAQASYPLAVQRIADRGRSFSCVVTDQDSCPLPNSNFAQQWTFGQLRLMASSQVDEALVIQQWKDRLFEYQQGSDPDWARILGDAWVYAVQNTGERLDAAEILCLASQPAPGRDPCAVGDIPEINRVEDLAVLEGKLRCMADRVAAAAAATYLQGVPTDVADSVVSGAVTATYPRSSGKFGGSVAEYRAAMVQISTSLQSVETALRDSAVAFELARSGIRRTDIALQSNLIGMEISGLQLAREQTQRLNDCLASASPSISLSLSPSVSFNLGSIFVCANSFAQIAMAAQLKDLNDELSNLDQADINETRKGVLLEAMGLFGTKVDVMKLGFQDFIAAYAKLNALNAEIDGHRRGAARALAKMAFLDRDDTGREYNVNRVMRSRMNTDRIRYQRAKENAIKMAWIARKAIEQRVGMDLSDIHTNMTLVPPPASWADTVCTMSGIDYNRIRSVDDDKIENYADGYIGDYVTLLENFVESYRFDYPFQDGEDVAVLSMRDEVFGVGTTCDLEGNNLLLWTTDTSSGGRDTAPGWTSNRSGEYAVTAVAATSGGPFAGSAKKGGVSTLLSLGCTLNGTTTCTATGASASQWQQVLPDLAAGEYVVSWYEKLSPPLDPGMDPTCADVAHTSATRLIATVTDEPVAPAVTGAPLAFLMNQAPAYVPATSDADLTDACNWRRVVAAFNNPIEQDVTFGWGIREVVASLTNLPSVEWAAPQLEYAPLNASATASAWFPTDDDWSYPVGLCPDTDGKLFATPLNWSRRCEQICADGLGTACVAGPDAATLERCFHEASFNISLADIERGKLGDAGGFAVGNFNYRFNEVGINLVGTGLRDCSETDTPATCYSSAFIPYSIRHSPPYRIRNYEGEVVEGNLFPGNIEHAKGLMAERYITNPIGSADRTLMTDYWRQEFRGRPLEGNFRLRIWDSPGFDFSKLEDIQLIMSYRYWTRAQ